MPRRIGTVVMLCDHDAPLTPLQCILRSMLHAIKPNARHFVLALLCCAPGAGSVNAAPVRTDHSEATWLADHDVVRPGQRFNAALRLRHDAGWHSYWINPGDSGLATRLALSLPEGWEADALRWPAPVQFEVDGLASYGYAVEIWLPFTITVPDHAAVDSEVTLSGAAHWLACADICVAEEAAIELRLRIGESSQQNSLAESFAR